MIAYLPNIAMLEVTNSTRPALVDVIDFERLNRSTWCLDSDGYAIATINTKTVKLHHAVIGKPAPGFVTDHKDRDRLNNTRNNLHHVTYKENSKNRTPSAAHYKPDYGIYTSQFTDKFRLELTRNGKSIYLGLFTTREEARAVRDAYLLKETQTKIL